MKNSKLRFSVYDMAIVGVMAAICFATTFLSFQIATPGVATMLKIANAFCLLSGMLFGGVRGGLAAGIGSMLFDLVNPLFAPSAPFTLVFFFLMAFICGVIAFPRDGKEPTILRNVMGASVGAFSYVVLHISKSIITLMLTGSTFWAAFTGCSINIVTSSINAIFAIVVASILAPLLRTALKRAGFYNKIMKSKKKEV